MKNRHARAGAPISLIETKTCKGLYENIVSFENLHSAFRKAAKGKETLAALTACRRAVRRFADAYVLIADDSKFFHIVDHRVLLDLLGRKIADENVMRLCAEIPASPTGFTAH